MAAIDPDLVRRNDARASSAGVPLPLLLAPVLGINFLFACRYLSRLGMNIVLLVAVYMLTFVALLALVWRMPEAVLKRRSLFAVLLASVSLGCIVVFQIVDVRDLRVDRWFMIDMFWNNVANGRYPYAPRPDSNVPGGLPFYFVLALPFHLTGDIGYFTLAGVLGYAYLARRQYGLSRATYVALMTLFLSMSFLWEIVTRSTLVVNMVVELGYLYWLDARRPGRTRDVVAAGLVGGLVLSTRSVAVLPLVVYVVHAWLREGRGRDAAVLGASMCTTFLLTILPLYLWDPILFERFNPFVQSGFLGKGAAAAVLAVAALFGRFSRSLRDVIASSGLVLFLAVLLAFAPATMEAGLSSVLFEDPFDVSYFNLSLPFLAFALGQFTDADRSRDVLT